MRSTIAQSVGVDISKDTLDVAIHPGGESFRITNNPEGHRALIKRLKGFDIARIVFEATGAYHRLFQQALVEADLPWVKVNPCQARRFAPATGKLAKTDQRIGLVRICAGGVQQWTSLPRPSVDSCRSSFPAGGACISQNSTVFNIRYRFVLLSKAAI